MLHLESPWDSALPAAQAKSTNNLHAAVLSLSHYLSLCVCFSTFISILLYNVFIVPKYPNRPRFRISICRIPICRVAAAVLHNPI